MTNSKDQGPKFNVADGQAAPSTTAKAEQSQMITAKDQDVDVPALDSRIQGLIGRKLRMHYDTLVNDKIPDNLLQLLDDLARSERDPKKEG